MWKTVTPGERFKILAGPEKGQLGTVREEVVSQFGHRWARLDLDGGGEASVRTVLLEDVADDGAPEA